ncbi:putative HVA22-like protein g [Vigna umbellata]|uniref:putative HVA22-like protein g n=1 Tax=Vigna umbellata TaxID=87088 RepID=UPI001F5EE68E|nr:putative HVA22-like protein g [Vigna umbellata]
MLGDFINRILILLLGYAYPGFECYKTVEKNRIDMEELRFWCKYWIIVALFTVLEKFPDIFFGWLPLYGEMKLVFFVWLWYPKTKGTGYIYETFLKPYVSKHENDIDRKIMEWKARGWDYVIFYWQFVAKYGQTAFLQALHQMASQSHKFSANPNSEKKEGRSESAPEEAPKQAQSSFMKQSTTLSKGKNYPSNNQTQTVELHNVSKSEYKEHQQARDPQTVGVDGEGHRDDDEPVSVKDRITQARARLRRLDSQQQPQSPRTPRTPTRQHQQKQQ